MTGGRGAGDFDLAVVGSGIVGLGAAYAGLRRGLRVVVIDRAADIAGASVRNFGHLCVTPQAGDALAYGLTAREIWLDLARRAGFWLREAGTLVVARHADERDLLEAFVAGSAQHSPGVEPRMLSAAQLGERAPVDTDATVAGALLPADLQVNPREAAPRIAAFLRSQGVEFRMRTAALSVHSGGVETSRGPVTAATVVVAVNHDIDQLYPALAERTGLERCGLDMLRVAVELPRPLSAPLLTGWSLIRYPAFEHLAETRAVRGRLHAEHPDLAALDVNLMFTQLPDGTLLVGDTHHRGQAISPFQSEAAAEALLRETRALFGAPPLRVLERWQGIYAAGDQHFVRDEPAPGVLVATVATGVGMTTGLGFAEHVLADHLDVSSPTIPVQLVRGGTP